MNLFASLFMLLGMVAQVNSLTENEIDTMVRNMMASKSYLKDDTLDSSATYQSKAFQAVKNNLKNIAGKEEKHVRNYFAAACIFYATNAQPNQVLAREQGPDYVIPSWKNTEGWIVDADYCNWFGVTCFLDILDDADQLQQIQEENIIEIQLYNNTLHGNWPQEVGLLGDHLVTIDLYDNYYHSAFEYEWFQDMTALNYLWFGSTSWDAFGIPLELNLLTNLRKYYNIYIQ